MSPGKKPEIVTIGVHGWHEEAFFEALRTADIDTFCDIRARRGVRGSEYAFANNKRLQERIAALGIRYVHHPEVAPSEETRKRQHEVDEATHTARRKRAELSPAFIEGYNRDVMQKFDSAAFVESLGPDAGAVALMCVEREPAACHRSLLAARLANDLGLEVKHIVP